MQASLAFFVCLPQCLRKLGVQYQKKWPDLFDNNTHVLGRDDRELLPKSAFMEAASHLEILLIVLACSVLVS